MADAPIKVPVDDETLRVLREMAAEERRATVDQAAVILAAAAKRRTRRSNRGVVAARIDETSK